MKKIIIIGGGPAGITAGYELLKQSKDYHVIILEKEPAVGGISKTIYYKGNRMDLGGHRFFSKDTAVTNWWEHIMPAQGFPAWDDKLLNRDVKKNAGGPDPEIEDRVMLKRNRVSRIFYRHRFFDYPVKMNIRTIKNLGAAATIQAALSYFCSVVHKLPETSLENFYINRFGKTLYHMFFQGYTTKLWGRHPQEISADWGAQRVKGLSIYEILKDIVCKIIPASKQEVQTSLIEEFSYPKYGPGQMWSQAAEDFLKMGNGEILTCSEVFGLSSEDNKITAVTYLDKETGKRITEEADIVISSMPLKDLVSSICCGGGGAMRAG